MTRTEPRVEQCSIESIQSSADLAAFIVECRKEFYDANLLAIIRKFRKMPADAYDWVIALPRRRLSPLSGELCARLLLFIPSTTGEYKYWVMLLRSMLKGRSESGSEAENTLLLQIILEKTQIALEREWPFSHTRN